MKNGWTGGQYSLVRAALGAYLFIQFVSLIPSMREGFEQTPPLGPSALFFLPNVLAFADIATPLVIAIAIASIFFAIGLYDRIAAVLIWYVLACLFGRSPLIVTPALPYGAWLLLVHVFVPRAPFGSWAARGRIDPRGGWTMPSALYAAMWMALSLGYAFSSVTKSVSPLFMGGVAIVNVLMDSQSHLTFFQALLLSLPARLIQAIAWGGLALELLYALLALFRRVRPWIWVAMLVLHVGVALLVDFADLSFMVVILHLFLFDPAWVRPLAVGTSDTLQYDGSCGLCHRSVRFVLAEDRSGNAFRFEPLPEGDKTSVIVQTSDGKTLERSDAVIHILQRLGGFWRVFGIAFSIVPRVVRNAMYDGVARVRYRIFGRTKDACPLVPPDLRSRFT